MKKLIYVFALLFALTISIGEPSVDQVIPVEQSAAVAQATHTGLV